MVKVRILDLGKMARGGNVTAPYAEDTYTDIATGSYRNTIQPVDRDMATLEAERGEVVMGDVVGNGTQQTFDIKGDNHATEAEEAQGIEKGTPLAIDDGFIFSKRLFLDSEEKKYFGIDKKCRVSFADAAKEFMNNKYISRLEKDTSDNIDRDTAELKIANNNEMLTKLALLQESKKGFDGGLPQGSEEMLAQYGIEQQDILPQEEQPQMAYGGKFDDGGTKRKYNNPFGESDKVYFTENQDDMFNRLAILDEQLANKDIQDAIRRELEDEISNNKIRNQQVKARVQAALSDPNLFNKFIESFKKINLLNQVAKSRGYNQEHTGNTKQSHEVYYDKVKDLISRDEFENLTKDLGDDGIGFQSIYTGLSKAVKSGSVPYNIGVEALGKDTEHWNDKRQTGIRYDDNGNYTGTSSAIDGLIWDNTLQQTAIGNEPEEETPEDAPDNAPAERPTADKEVTEAARPPYGWSRGDIRNYMNSLLDYYTEKKYNPYLPRTEYVGALPYHVNFEQGVNQLQSQANNANELASQYGPQAAAAMMQASQANIIPGIAAYIDQSNKTNQGIDNQWAMQDAAARNAFNLQKAGLEKQYYDESIAAQQNYDNAKRALRRAALTYRNIGDTNASLTWNENMTHPEMAIDPYTRMILHVPEAQTLFEPGQVEKSGTELYLQWVNNYGKYLPEEARLAMFYHLTGTQPTGRDTNERYNIQEQKALEKQRAEYIKSLNKVNS